MDTIETFLDAMFAPYPATPRLTDARRELRAMMATVPDLATFRELLGRLDHSIGYPGAAVEGSRGRAGSPKKPHLPDGWLNSRILGDAERLGLVEAELDISGG